jgi:hypothetical protein
MADNEDQWTYETKPILFELRMPIEHEDQTKIMVIERTPDENAARMAFDAARKALSYLKPRPKACVELYLGTTALDVFEQTQEGEEFDSDALDLSVREHRVERS